MARLAIAEEAERLLNSLEERKTTIVHFDTDKPANDSTGLPPVKTIVTQETKREEVERLDTRKKVQRETEQKQETIDKRCEAHSQYIEVDEKFSWWHTLKQHIMYVLLIPMLIIALWATYKLIKNLK